MKTVNFLTVQLDNSISDIKKALYDSDYVLNKSQYGVDIALKKEIQNQNKYEKF